MVCRFVPCVGFLSGSFGVSGVPLVREDENADWVLADVEKKSWGFVDSFDVLEAQHQMSNEKIKINPKLSGVSMISCNEIALIVISCSSFFRFRF